jgi:hypothetical protein
MSDFVPKSLSNMAPWLTGLHTGITNDAADCGQTPAEILNDNALVDLILGPVADANAKETAALEAHGTAMTAIKQNMPALRDMLNRYKHATGWTEGMADAWAVSTSTKTYDRNTHAPTITAAAAPGKNVIKGAKPGFTSADIQMRVTGTSTWITIGVKISSFPFYDTTVPQTPGKPESREYRALGYIGDEQVGQPSDIVTAVFNG